MTFAVAGFVQGLTGFGFGIVAMAVLPLLLRDFETAFAITAINSLIIPGLTFISVRKGLKIRDCIPLTAAAVVGAIFGFFFTHWFVGSPVFIQIFGGTLVVFAIVDLILTKALKKHLPGWVGWPCGLAGGFFGGAFNVGGPPMVAFCYSQPWSKQQIVATLQVAFICATSLRVALMGASGYFDQRIMILTLATVIPISIGIWLGGLLLARIPLPWLRIGVFTIVIILGLQYFIFPEVVFKR